MNPHWRCLHAKVKYRNEPKQVMPKSEDLSRSLEIKPIIYSLYWNHSLYWAWMFFLFNFMLYVKLYTTTCYLKCRGKHPNKHQWRGYSDHCHMRQEKEYICFVWLSCIVLINLLVLFWQRRPCSTRQKSGTGIQCPILQLIPGDLYSACPHAIL